MNSVEGPFIVGVTQDPLGVGVVVGDEVGMLGAQQAFALSMRLLDKSANATGPTVRVQILPFGELVEVGKGELRTFAAAIARAADAAS